MSINKVSRIEELKNSYRMFHIENDDNGINKTDGLLMFVNEVMTDNFVVAEIGSFCGVSSEVFALHCKELYCIDSWEDWNNDGIIFQAMERFDNMKSNYEHISKLHMRGDKAVKHFEDEFFNLVYIDASHWYTDVIKDIECWLPKVKKGGYLSGHDYVFGVDTFNAVNDYFGKTHSITVYPDSTWSIKKK